MLDTQYRMHPQISSFPNEAFYSAQLKDGTRLRDGTVKKGLEPPDTAFLLKNAQGERQNVTFVDIGSPETPQNLSLANEGEAAMVCDIVMDLLLENEVSVSVLCRDQVTECFRISGVEI